MKRTFCSISLLLLSFPLVSYAADQLIPAGSILTCSVSEGRISSKTTAIGDPVLCTLNPVEKYGRSVLPYGSYMEGRFEDYKDPGHFVGKGWMQLSFDRIIIGNRVIPVSAKVVQVPKYRVDEQGRILGNGHPVKDTIEWLIPVLWPLDLINLPRRGPRPVLKPETPLTLELMEDLGIPDQQPQYPQQQQAALIERQPPQQQAPQQQPVIYQNFQNYQPAPAPQQQVVYEQPYYPPTVVVRPAWCIRIPRLRHQPTHTATTGRDTKKPILPLLGSTIKHGNGVLMSTPFLILYSQPRQPVFLLTRDTGMRERLCRCGAVRGAPR